MSALDTAKPRNRKQQCLYCQYEEFKQMMFEIADDKRYSDRVRMGKIRLYKTYMEYKLRDIKRLKYLQSCWPCPQHIDKVKEIRDKFNNGVKHAENEREVERQALKSAMFGMLGFIDFIVKLYGDDSTEGATILVQIKRYYDYLNYRLERLDAEFEKLRVKLENE